jgi:hypothetical protein
MTEEILTLKGKDAREFDAYISRMLTAQEKKSFKEADEFYANKCADN